MGVYRTTAVLGINSLQDASVVGVKFMSPLWFGYSVHTLKHQCWREAMRQNPTRNGFEADFSDNQSFE
jgi:hypothetical protein